MSDDELRHRTLHLARNVRALRKSAGLSGQELGARASMSQSKISKIESGRFTPSEADIVALAHALGLDEHLTADLRRQATGLQHAWKTHRDVLGEQRSGQQRRSGEREAIATSIDTCCINLIPALLQTPEYAEAMLRVARVWWSESELDKHLVLRMQRQAQLYDLSREFRFLLTESSLRTVFGSREILRSQVRALKDFAQRPNVQVAVLDELHPQAISLVSVFSIHDRGLVIVELPVADVEFQEPEDVSAYCDLFERAWREASRDIDHYIARYAGAIDERSSSITSL